MSTPPRSSQPSSRIAPSRCAWFGNVALVPASELADLPIWQERAYQFPHGELLIVVPQSNAHLEEVGRRICLVWKEPGRHSTVATIRPPRT